MIKNLALLLLAIPVVWFGGQALARAFASDETLVQWLVQDMERGYGANRVNPVLGPIAPEWRHEGAAGVGRQDLGDGLRHRFFTERHPETRERLDRVAIDWDTWSVLVLDDAASAEFELEVEQLERGAWVSAARARFEVEFERREKGWRIVRSSHEELLGELY